MEKKALQALTEEQIKLEAIQSLSGYILKLDNVEYKNEIARLIQRILEANYLSSGLAREVQHYSLLASGLIK